ncbi:MAG: glycosyltransferase, partial [Fusobacteriaceae bacterium]
MKKMIYFNYINPLEKGVRKKIEFQKKSFKKLGYQTNEIKVDFLKGHQNLFYENKVLLNNLTVNATSFKEKIIKNLEWKKVCTVVKDKVIENDIDLIYIRYPGSNKYFIKFLKKIKMNNIKIIIEIPTYPYDKESKKIHISKILDKIYRQKLYKYVDKIVTYSEDKEIWGIPCINISNGIDLEEVKMVNKKSRDTNKIVFTSVSNCSFWHGIDRFLLSLEEYGKKSIKKDILFNIVGEGAESNKFKDIVSRSEYLSKVVVFKGFKSGKELDDIYDETDIGLGSLARHRSGLETMRALKNREYCAKGLPMIFSEDDPDLRDVPFVYHVTPDEKLIDIDEVINWYENIKLKPE